VPWGDDLALGLRGPKPIGNEFRFWRLVTKGEPDECWPWRGATIRGGYGNFRETNPRRTVHAHRFAYELVCGPIPAGLMVLHTCDNPSCVNPSHLFVGTDADNMRDKTAKGRTPHGEAHWRHKFTDTQVLEIRRLAAAGMTYSAIGRLLGVGDWTVGRIAKGLSRREMTNAME